MNLDILANIADIVAIPIALLGIYFIVKQMSLSLLESEEEHKRRKNEITINAYNDMREELREISFKVRGKLHIKDMYTKLNEEHVDKISMDEELKNDVSKMLSIFERFSVGVYYDVFNKNLINDLSGTVFIKTYEQFEPYIKKVRNNSETFYINFERLVEDINDIRKAKK